jgi:4-alpha-glucanotransferase
MDYAKPGRYVSAFAIDPVYLCLSDIPEFDSTSEIANLAPKNVAELSKYKTEVLHRIFTDKIDKSQLCASPGFLQFQQDSQFWLPTYSHWSSLHQKATSPLFYDWLQYQCHIQLLSVARYATEHRIILSSALVIGLSENSADISANPHLFDLRYTIGSPPDIFSFHGRNFFFPVWNWSSMKTDGFQWFRHQLSNRQRYFSGCMMDRPYGVFRAWNIPSTTDNPLMGHFVPSIPIDSGRLREMQIGDVSGLCRPLFPIGDVLSMPLCEEVKERMIKALAVCENGVWHFRSVFETDREIRGAIKRCRCAATESGGEGLQFKVAEKILLAHFESVCLIADCEKPHRSYYPRYSMTDSTVFKSLPDRDAQVVYKLFVDFYNRTNNDLWREQSAEKLAILAGCDLQFYAIDLGISLNDEEKALNRVGVCALHVQRVPRESTSRFDVNIPYLSVNMVSTHEMEPIGKWFEENQADAQQFYYQILKMEGEMPRELTEIAARRILQVYFESNSMWCVCRLEDLWSLRGSGGTRNVEKMMEDGEWTGKIGELIEGAERGRRCFYEGWKF